MSVSSSYKAMLEIVEQAKDGAIIIPDDFTMCGTLDAARSELSHLCCNVKSIVFHRGNDLGNFAYQSKLMQLAVIAMREIGEKVIAEHQLQK